jgi:hypothetical protein
MIPQPLRYAFRCSRCATDMQNFTARAVDDIDTSFIGREKAFSRQGKLNERGPFQFFEEISDFLLFFGHAASHGQLANTSDSGDIFGR